MDLDLDDEVTKQNKGTYVESYHKLYKYSELLKQTNAGTVVEFDYEQDCVPLSGNPQFKRVFACLYIIKVGFLEA